MTKQVNDKRIGVWLIGALGGVGTTISVGISAMKRGLAPSTGLTTELAEFADLGLCGFDNIVVGGHDVRRSTLVETAAELHHLSGVFTAEMLDKSKEDLAAWSENIRPGVLRRSGKPVEAFADWQVPGENASDADLIEHAAKDLREFRERHNLAHVVVVNVSSSEPVFPLGPEHENWSALSERLTTPGEAVIPASSVYGLAAVEADCSFINFTPSLGLSSPALRERADAAGILYGGQDGKTGETLMKAVLAPMFAHRNLQVMSWVGHNILGNRDGKVLQDPVNKQGKIEAKGNLIGQILGYQPESLVTIEHIESMGDWKTAWDHIHFKGFLGTKMSLQFIWQGCDSLLAGPLAIDLIRWTELGWRRGEHGCLRHLACYFKSPMGVEEQDFFRQWDMLQEYADQVRLGVQNGSAEKHKQLVR